MQLVAQAWLVLSLTNSGGAVGAVIAVQTAPTLLFGWAGGLIADRVSKRRLLICTSLVSCGLTTALGVLTLTGLVRLWMVFAVAGACGTADVFDIPSRHSFVTELVGPNDTTSAVTLNSIANSTARVLGPALAGVLIASIGTGSCFIVNGASYAVIAVTLAMMRRSELYPSAPAPRAPGQLREAARYSWRTREIRTTLIVVLAFSAFAYNFNVTLPLLAKFTFDSGSTGLAILSTVLGIGAVAGGLLNSLAGMPSTRRLALTAAATGCSLLVLSVAPSLAVAAVAIFFAGAACVSVVIISTATCLLGSSPELRGRVMSLVITAIVGSQPIGGPVLGVIAERTSPRVAVAFAATVTLIAAAYAWMTHVSRLRSAAVRVAPG